MRRVAQFALVAAGLAAATVVSAQARAPEIPFEAVDALGGFPEDIHLGEVGGVARNSRGEIYVYTRTGNPNIAIGIARYISRGGSRLFKFDSRGRYEREMGQGIYGALFAQQTRVSPDDDIWIVDRMSGQVIRFDPQGRITMVLSRKPEALQVPAGGGGGGGRGGGRGYTEGESFQQPSDVAWDSQGNIYVADGLTRGRVAKYDATGRFVTNYGGEGSGDGQFTGIHGLQIDARDNLYVADYGNRRITVLDSQGRFVRQMTGFGAPAAICITPGPNQVMYVSNSNPPDDLEVGGEIYKMRLDGTIIGRFGTVGKRIGQFGTVNAIDCRNENDLLVGEIGNWRVQRVTLRPTE
jgi:hypothetical protein